MYPQIGVHELKKERTNHERDIIYIINVCGWKKTKSVDEVWIVKFHVW